MGNVAKGISAIARDTPLVKVAVTMPLLATATELSEPNGVLDFGMAAAQESNALFDDGVYIERLRTHGRLG